MTGKQASQRHQRLAIGVLYNGKNANQERVLAGIESAVVERDVHLYCFDAGGVGVSDNAGGFLAGLANKRLIDGLIILAGAFTARSPRGSSRLYKRFHPLPLVTVGFTLPSLGGVLSDCRRGMRDLVAHLVKTHRRKRIAFLSGPSAFPPAQERLRDYLAACRRLKVPARKGLILTGDGSAASGRQAAAALFSGKAPACDAILAFNDAMAAGALEELARRGVRIPEDCAVAGFFDEDIARCALLPLTTVKVKPMEMGASAIELLIRTIGGELKRPVLKTTSELVVRESCGCRPPEAEPADAAGAERPASKKHASARRRPAEARRLDERLALFRLCQRPEQGRLIREVEQKILAAPDLAAVKRVIYDDFPRLGIARCFFSLRDGRDAPLVYASLAAAYDLSAPVKADRHSTPYIANRLLPPGLAASARRRTLYVETLSRQGDFAGLLLLHGERPDFIMHEILRESLESALAQTQRLSELRLRQDDLETQLEAGHRELIEANQKLQREKRLTEKMQEELERSETRYRRWFEEDFTGNFIAAGDGRIINCNKAFARIFGFPSVIAALGANFGDFYPNKSALEDFYTLLGVVRRIEYYESEFVRKDGNIIHIIGNIIGSFDEDSALIEMQGFLFDNTERKRLEDELRHAHKMDAIGRLAGGIAHDFNNILTGIMGYSELLLNKIPKSDPSQRDVEEIKKAAKSAASLTRQLLAFSRKQILKPLLLDLNDVVRSMRDLLIRLIGEHISLVTELDHELKPVKADRGQIEQVLMNLVINSRDALPHGGTIVVTTRNKVIESTHEFPTTVDIKPGPYVVLEVNDNGVGMDLETQSHIFEPFFSTKKLGQGVGLGLSTVYGIITQSGGFPEVMSEPHRGTTMRIYLPQYTSTAEVREERLQYQEEVKGNETILLVEDEAFVRDLAEKVLSNEGYHVMAAHNAQEAMSLIKKHSLTFDLVVTDIVMPGISGVELGQKIQALRPEIRVLYMSGYDDKMLSQQGDDIVRLNFIQKPFTPELFLRKVQEALSR